MNARRWWLMLAAIATMEAGCLTGTYWLTKINVP